MQPIYYIGLDIHKHDKSLSYLQKAIQLDL